MAGRFASRFRGSLRTEGFLDDPKKRDRERKLVLTKSFGIAAYRSAGDNRIANSSEPFHLVYHRDNSFPRISGKFLAKNCTSA